MIKLTITQLGQVNDVNTKFGPKKKSSIRTKEKGNNWLGYWIGKTTESWKVGDVIEVEAINPREYNGKTYYDLVLPKFNQMDNLKTEFMAIVQRIDSVNTNVKRIIDHLSGVNRLDLTSAGTKVPDFSEVDITADDIPFE